MSDSRAQVKHWDQMEWPIRETLKAGILNIVNDPIVSREKIIFSPLHNKEGLMKQFLKALNTDGECFQHIFSVLLAPLVAVYAIRGQTARLPCNMTSPNKEPAVLVLWLRNGTKTPVFSVDMRTRPQSEAKLRSPEDLFGDRAMFESRSGVSTLVIQKTRFSDEGLFRCRVDYKSTPTHIERVLLNVVDPPRSIRLYSRDGAVVGEEISVQDGHSLALVCRAFGGDPHPNVTWWAAGGIEYDSIMEDSSQFLVENGNSSSMSRTSVVENALSNGILSGEVIKGGNLTCIASNNPDINPLSKSVKLLLVTDMSLKVQMTAPKNPLTGGKEYEIPCKAHGVKPPPSIRWQIGDKTLKENIIVQHLGTSGTKSVLRLRASSGDHKKELECVGTAPSLPHITARDSTLLHVNYVPEARITLLNRRGELVGQKEESTESSGSSRGFSDGDSASFVCKAEANPPTYNITFRFNGRALKQRERMTQTGYRMTLINLTHEDAGLYTCLASNSVGDGPSNAVRLNINYPPVCEVQTPQEVIAFSGEIVKLKCQVSSSPPDISFNWWVAPIPTDGRLEPLNEEPIEHEDEGLFSTGLFKVSNSTPWRYQAKCWASNTVGKTSVPCIFNIKLVELPGPLIDCHQEAVSTYSANVSCSPGASGGLPQHYILQVHDVASEQLVHETSSTESQFWVSNLKAGRRYRFVLFAAHAKGRGKKTSLIILTLNPQAEEVVNPNAGEQPRAQSPSPTPSKPTTTSLPVSLIVGLSSGIAVTMALIIALLVQCRGRIMCKNHHRRESIKVPDTGISSRESLLDLREAANYQACSPSRSKELLSSFSPAPKLVNQIPKSSLDSHISSSVLNVSPSGRLASSNSTPDVSSRVTKVPRTLRFKETDIRRINKLAKGYETNTRGSHPQLGDIVPDLGARKYSSDGSEAGKQTGTKKNQRKYSSDGREILKHSASSSHIRKLSSDGAELGNSLETKRELGRSGKDFPNGTYITSVSTEAPTPTIVQPGNLTPSLPLYYNPRVVFHHPSALPGHDHLGHPATTIKLGQHQKQAQIPNQAFQVVDSSQLQSSELTPPRPSTFSSQMSTPSTQGLGWRIENLRRLEILRKGYSEGSRDGGKDKNDIKERENIDISVSNVNTTNPTTKSTGQTTTLFPNFSSCRTLNISENSENIV